MKPEEISFCCKAICDFAKQLTPRCHKQILARTIPYVSGDEEARQIAISQINDLILEKYDIKNGICGFQRDIFMAVFSCLEDLNVARKLLALTLEYFEYKSHPNFLLGCFGVAMSNLPLVNQPERTGSFMYFKRQVFFASGQSLAVINVPIQTGIWRLEVRFTRLFKYGGNVGVIHTNPSYPLGSLQDARYLAQYSNYGSCFQNKYSYGNEPWDESDIVSIELNMIKRQLCFYLNGVLQPIVYVNIPCPMRFFVSSIKNNSVCELRRLFRVNPIPSSVDAPRITKIFDPNNEGLVPRQVEWSFKKNSR